MFLDIFSATVILRKNNRKPPPRFRPEIAYLDCRTEKKNPVGNRIKHNNNTWPNT